MIDRDTIIPSRTDVLSMARIYGTPVQEQNAEVEYRFTLEELERFAALVAEHEREAIMDEWWMCVQSDLENGVKSLNERAAEKWRKEYPAMAGFDAAIRARGNK